MTEGKSCPSCGAQNEPAAQFCWQCYGRFGAGIPAAVGVSVPAAVGVGPSVGVGGPVAAPAAVGGGPSPTAAAQGPPPLPPWQQSGGYASSTSLPEPTPQRGFSWGRIVNLLLIAAVMAGGFLGWRTFMGDPFPRSVAGLPRIEAQSATVFEDAVKETGKQLGIKMRGAVYGQDSSPTLMAILSEREGAGGGLDAAFLEPLPVSDPRLPGTSYEERVREGASFRCFSFSAELTGTGCFWLDDETTGFVFAQEAAVSQGMDLAAAVRRAVT